MIGFPNGYVLTYQPPVSEDAPPRPPAESDQYCPTAGCDTAWWGPESCWVCGAEGVSRAALPESDRKVWMWSNQFRPSTEGDLPV